MKTILLLMLILSGSIYGQWIQQNSTTSLSLNSVDFVNEQTGWIVGAGGIILRTSNGGMQWSQQNSTTTNILNDVSFADVNTGFISAFHYVNMDIQFNLVLKTTNSGMTWDTIFFSVQLNNYRKSTSVSFFNSSTGILTNDGSNGFVSRGEVLRTTNSGVNWVNVGFRFDIGFVNSVTMDNQVGYVLGRYFTDLGDDTSYVYKTTDAGNSWNEVFRTGVNTLTSISAVNENVVLTGVSQPSLMKGVILKSSDSGLSWNSILQDSIPSLRSSYFVNSSTGWSVGILGSIYFTTNNGQNWTLQIQNVNSLFNDIQMFSPCTGYAVGSDGIIYKTTNCGITALNNISTSVPENISLFQNYPNPFNPSTKIKFQIPRSRGMDAVGGRGVLSKLSIYNALGHEVQVLANESLQPGTYEVDWDASTYPSGVYYYKLESGNFAETKKMVLIK